MFPMIAEVNEFVRARAVLDAEIARMRGQGKPLPVAIRVGSMLEVPALGWQLPALSPLVDFISVGSNDLIQFLFAADRGNLKLAQRYDPLCPSVLGYLRWVARQCDERDVPLTLCGEMASRPLEAMAVLGAGFRRISVAAASVGPVKEMLRGLDLKRLETAMAPLYQLPDHSVRRQLQNFARDNGVVVG